MTLHKHYRAEIDLGIAEADAKIAKTLFEIATVDKNVTAAIFWAKARMGWSERHDIDDEGKKAKAQREARSAGIGTEWGNDLVSPVMRVVN